MPHATPPSLAALLAPTDTFVRRHLGSDAAEVRVMLDRIGSPSVAALIDETIPSDIRLQGELDLGPARGEHELLGELRRKLGRNRRLRSFIGAGYYGTITPPVILRNVLENPGWYTAYTPYQAEIAQGRLEALLNFQTMVSDLTGLPLCNASLLDEATAAAEAMTMCQRSVPGDREVFVVADDVHPQTLAVVQARAEALGIRVRVADPAAIERGEALGPDVFGALLQVPNTTGGLTDVTATIAAIHGVGAKAVVATDLLALTLITPPGEQGADAAIGSAQRFGVPMGFGGPHAAFLATREEFKRHLPGRIIGVSKDARGEPALRMAMQTREQHIRREKATSNICTAQVLLAVIASFYGVYHGPEGLTAIATRVHGAARVLAGAAGLLGLALRHTQFFDTITVAFASEAAADAALAAAVARGYNLRRVDGRHVGVALDETVTRADLEAVVAALAAGAGAEPPALEAAFARLPVALPVALQRSSAFLTHEHFHRYRTEHELLRYLHRLESRDLSLTSSMIALGSCTMKLNATSEMIPVTWPETDLHPFVPADQATGYAELLGDLERWLCEITGFQAVSLQPNAGAQGEYAGLLTIRAYHRARGEAHRDVCLIPVSAHGTNPASAIMAGMRVVIVQCDANGNVDVADLRAKAEVHGERLAALMVTYPSTHGVFEREIREICAVIHRHGGKVYMDGANMNAQVGLCRPGDFGADVCHLNLHKTFCIPHGGGGPGMGPIGVTADLAPFLPGHPLVKTGGAQAIGPVSAAPFGSASILPISWMYIALMGAQGLRGATELAILNANYMAARLQDHYPILYRGERGRVAHEFIVDVRPFKASAGIEPEDIAKRLMDYGFHAPTMSFPVAGTLMIEPTESESKAELDRFCDAMIAIRGEIAAIERGELPRDDNPLKHAPHPASVVLAGEWTRPYPREQAAFPAPWLREHKFWPAVGRIDNAFGDRHLICTCPPIESYEAAQ
jgi:glycine dehydrogenase